MLASPALPARRGILTRPLRAAAATPAQAHATTVAFRPAPFAPWARNHLTFRGTRILTAAVLFWSGTILFAFGALVVPAAHDAGQAQVDAGLMALLGSVAPWLTVLGVANVVGAYGAARDRRWWTALTTWVLAAGALAILAGVVFAVAGRDPFALTALGQVSPAGQGLGILASTLALEGIAAWGVRRVVNARGIA